MPDAVNPYASPTAVETPTANADQVLKKLSAPALGLLIISGLGVAFVLVVLLCATVALVALMASGNDPFRVGTFDPGFIFFLVMGAANALVFAGAWNMPSGKRYRLCAIAALLGSLPITPICLGIPFAIWAICVLLRQDVREAFALIAKTRLSGSSIV